MAKQWKHYYTRAQRLQDVTTYILPTFDFSKGLIKEVLYIPVKGVKGKWEAWFVADEFESMMKQLGEKVLQKNWTLPDHLKKFTQSTKTREQVVARLVKISKTATHRELLKGYLGLFPAYADFTLFIWMPWAITYFLEDWFVKRLKARQRDWQRIYEILAKPPRPIQMQQMIEDVWRWKLKGGGKPDLEKLVNKWRHLGVYSVSDKPWEARDLLQQASPFRDLASQLQKVEDEQRRAKQDIRKTIIMLRKHDALLGKVAEVINTYVWLRTERVDAYRKVRFLLQPFYRRLEKDFGWNYGLAGNLTYEEVVAALTIGKTPSISEMRARERDSYITYYTKKRTLVISDIKKRNKFIERIIGKQEKEENVEITGQVAQPGKVQGRVRLILNPKDASKLQKGEVLVANMTHPDYMIGIRKAAAIVTDEGGIVCHAAVISRELKIPCIIGTHNATKVFKDGDLVEVDAEVGVVKKIQQ
jgi:phosphoenolpyruvate synthase/pyruvate phosphate dikinase